MTTNTIGQLTELQAIGGGYFTEAFPTNFHHFYKRKVLVGSETADMFKDVTASEKTAIENADKAYVAPSDELLAWADSVGVAYNRTTGYFELNGLVDLSANDMQHVRNNYGLMFTIGNLPDHNARTNITEHWYSSHATSGSKANLVLKFYNCNNIEVISLDSGWAWPTSIERAFGNCYKLREIRGAINLTNYTNKYLQETIEYAFENCSRLESVNLILSANVKNVDLKDCACLSIESVSYMVTKYDQKIPCTITLHPDAFARLTTELVEAATAKQITFATTN